MTLPIGTRVRQKGTGWEGVTVAREGNDPYNNVKLANGDITAGWADDQLKVLALPIIGVYSRKEDGTFRLTNGTYDFVKQQDVEAWAKASGRVQRIIFDDFSMIDVEYIPPPKPEGEMKITQVR